VNYWYLGGKDKKVPTAIEDKIGEAEGAVVHAESKVLQAVQEAKDKAKEAVGK
jgi:uncharacterized protein YjbJ (UPF0337 family)